MKITFDAIDHQILELLQNNSGMTNKELAYAVGLSPSTCLDRVRKLKSDGTLLGAHAEVNADRLGIGIQAMLFVRLGKQSKGSADAILDHALKLKEVIDVYYLSGATDMQIHVAVRDVQHLRMLVLDDFLQLEGIEHVETSIIFRHARSHSLPNYEFEGEAEE